MEELTWRPLSFAARSDRWEGRRGRWFREGQLCSRLGAGLAPGTRVCPPLTKVPQAQSCHPRRCPVSALGGPPPWCQDQARGRDRTFGAGRCMAGQMLPLSHASSSARTHAGQRVPAKPSSEHKMSPAVAALLRSSSGLAKAAPQGALFIES